ncbi:YqgE/AlgH family protein [Magnetofaba australis]|uniref:UPF0301 protein MAIT1_03850 n=1 Tax=Magnetofaba australis IT-1 TaxID=1434232 RepID=A0A1Y2K8Z6_9PROT|nr:YqgE/AlgH family protein [Magnetofaba australis]OSM07221.1 hypothetical protein MAIT1_03850 [Magnetofaba australis IT-1]
MESEESIVGQFLVAMPTLEDTNFHHSVVFICAHSSEGAMGLVVNHPHSVGMTDVMEQLGLNWRRPENNIVYQGGPVSPERGFVLYEEDFGDSGAVEVQSHLFMGGSPEILERLSDAGAAARFLFTLGYAGWGDGQLEEEIRQNAWLVCRFDRELLFATPHERRWEMAIRSMGIDPALLVDGGGQAN